MDPEEILRRRDAGVSLEGRGRGTLTIEDIVYHQSLCEQRWIELVKKVGIENTLVVSNNKGELESAVRFVECFIDSTIISHEKAFIAIPKHKTESFINSK